jgi:hypothetical protein
MLQNALIQPIPSNPIEPSWAVSDNLKKSKILHAPFEIAGNMGKVCGFLRQAGIEAVSANYFDTWLKYECDHNFNLNSHSKEEQARIINNFTRQALEEFDIFHFHFGLSLQRDFSDLPEIVKRNKKIVFTFWGSDVRAPEWIMYQQAKYLGYDPPKPFFNTMQQYQLLRHINKFADVMLGTSIIPRGMHLRNDMDTSQWTLEEKQEILSQNIIKKDPAITYFVHAPTDNWKKGSGLIVPVFEKLKKQGWPIELIYVNKLPLPEAKKLYAYADYAVDQVGVGAIGFLGMEMMCWEIPVLVHHIPLFEKIKNNPPVIPITKATLEDQIAACIERKQNGELKQEGARAREWVLKNEDISVTFPEYLKMYDKLANNEQVPQYVNRSWFIQEEKILRGEKSRFYQYMQQSGAFKEIGLTVQNYDNRLYV